ncbi:MAG TPA: folylpolyglutamate synthase/dihydrofolate synthase family protein [Candidatus Dormibacteraeota bacterium]|nr:folylpolyglutamate synthase/dihydrofolate synthase family protein [Candidatus Dormibacteraeota bacterium]
MNRVGGSRARWTGKPARVGASGDAAINYRETLNWLYSLQRFGIKLGLENIQRLLEELSKSHILQLAHWKVVHVAGTNGKGSVCAIIDSICRAEGYRTGLFTSPHLVTFRERIRVNGDMISEDAVANGLTTIRNLVANWDPHPTFFEVVTALALKHFSDTRVKIVILETGLGGRLDATNAVQSDVSVITPIDFDHEKLLGKTIPEIAAEKAGIIKPGVPVVSAAQRPEAEKEIRARAAECHAPLEFATKPYDETPIALAGANQKQNAALAIAALRAAKIDTDSSAIARGLASIEWAARFQRWDQRTIIDGAHNLAAARGLAGTWREIFGDRRATLVLAILSDKNLRGICEALAPISKFVLLPKIRSERAADPDALAQIFSTITPSLPCSTTPSIARALELAQANSDSILITGSLHFAGEVLAHLRGEPAAFEECAQ